MYLKKKNLAVQNCVIKAVGLMKTIKLGAQHPNISTMTHRKEQKPINSNTVYMCRMA